MSKILLFVLCAIVFWIGVIEYVLNILFQNVGTFVLSGGIALCIIIICRDRVRQ